MKTATERNAIGSYTSDLVAESFLEKPQLFMLHIVHDRVIYHCVTIVGFL